MAKMRLAAARVNVNLTQKEAAKQLKISNKTLCNWESGKTFVPADKIDAICALYNVEYDDINFLSSNPL